MDILLITVVPKAEVQRPYEAASSMDASAL